MTKTALKSGKISSKKVALMFFKKSCLSDSCTSLLVQQQSTLILSGTENTLLRFFRQNMENLWSYLQSPLLNFSKCKFSNKNKNSLYFGLKCFILVFLAAILKKLYSYLKSLVWNFRKFQKIFCNFIQNKKNFKLGSKNSFLGKYRREFEKSFLMFEISPFESINDKNFKSGTRNDLFWYFQARI